MTQQTALVAVPEAIAKQQSRVVLQAQGIKLDTAEDYVGSTAFLKMLDEALEVGNQLFDENIGRWHAGHKAAVLQKKNFVAPFEQAMLIVKNARIKFRAIAEQRRQQQECLLREEAARQQTQELEAEAKTLERAGDPAAAEAIREFAEAAPAPVVVVATEVPKDSTVRRHRKFRITNGELIPRMFLIPDEKAIGAHGRSLGEKASIPGIEYFWSESESV